MSSRVAEMKGIDFFVEAWHRPRDAAFRTLGDLLKFQLICILREVIFNLPLIEIGMHTIPVAQFWCPFPPQFYASSFHEFVNV